jgi:hypothetical protein
MTGFIQKTLFGDEPTEDGYRLGAEPDCMTIICIIQERPLSC